MLTAPEAKFEFKVFGLESVTTFKAEFEESSSWHDLEESVQV
jgi:hypothetical protein